MRFMKQRSYLDGTDNGQPGSRPEYDESYYAGFVRDPDGNNIEDVLTHNIYQYTIDFDQVTLVQSDSIAHVGNLVHSIDYDAPEGTPVLALIFAPSASKLQVY